MNPKDEQLTEEQRAGREDFLRKELENVLLDPKATIIPNKIKAESAAYQAPQQEEKRHTIADLMSVTDDDSQPERSQLQASQAKNLKDKLQDISISYSEPKQATQTIRTFKSDVETAVKSGKANLISITAAELTRQNEALQETTDPDQNTTPTSSRGVIITALFVTVLLVVGGLIALYLAQKAKEPTPHVSNDPNNTNVQKPAIPALTITPQAKLGVNYDNRNLNLRANITSAIGQTSGKFGSITELLILGSSTSTVNIPFSTLSKTLELRMPASLARTIGEDYFLGVHHYGGNFPFILMSVDAYETATPAMIEWEKTLVEDVGYILRSKNDFANSPKDELSQKIKFKDTVIQNHDARVVLNGDSRVVFYYTFFDKNTLIIGTNGDTISLIESALAGRTVSQ